jgi:D-alanyl-D-alanine carboxypeptidase/D-alanyl-D-alanine-endopeptidase (penicillin-binding protein 4)
MTIAQRFCRYCGFALIALVITELPVLAEAAEDRLPAPMAKALQSAGIPQSAVAVLVQEVDGRRPSVAFNTQKALNPASVMKLVTTYAALELLGPAYTWSTGAYASAPVSNGRLAGDLYLKGSGDPKLSFEQFWLLLRQLRVRGIEHIDGDLVLDRSAFQLPDYDPAAFDNLPLRPYNVGPDALLLSFKSVRLRLVATPNGNVNGNTPGKVLAQAAEAMPAQIDVTNLIRLDAAAACGDWKEALRADLGMHGERAHLVLTGSYPAACGEKLWNLAVLDHPHYVLGVFRQLWQELGGSLAGGVRDGAVPEQARLLASSESAPLAEVVRDINKFSNNVMARQLFLTLGHALESAKGDATTVGKKPLRPEDADIVVHLWLARKNLVFPELVLDNGAGLSRRERISADSLGRLLAAAWKSPVMAEFMSSLPVVGVDGTMTRHLQQNGVTGHAHIKTGSIEGVKAIAGYVLDRAGRRQIVVILVNHANAAAAQQALEALLEWVYERK